MAGILKVDQVQSDSNLSFQVAGANVAYMNSTGLQMTGGTLSLAGTTIIPAVGQYAFPATQNASADANTLDDYEEGTWTPTATFSSGSITYQDQYGLYTKVGNLVTVSFWIRVAVASSPSGVLTITGLPFTSNGTASRPALVFRTRSLSGVTGLVGAWLSSNATSLNLEVLNNGTGSDLNATSIGNNSEFDAFLSYHV